LQLTCSFNVVAEALQDVGTALKEASRLGPSKHKRVTQSRELAVTKQDVAWWLHNHPQVRP